MIGPSTTRERFGSPAASSAFRRRPVAAELARYFLAVVYLTTALGKLLDNRGFAEVLAAFQVLPAEILLPFALAISLTELFLVVWLLSGIRLRLAALVSAIFSLGYIAWLGLALVRGLEIANCGCFGVFWARPLTPAMLLEDAVLVLVSAVLYAGMRERGPA